MELCFLCIKVHAKFPIVRTFKHTLCEALWRLIYTLLALAFPNKASIESLPCCFQQRSRLLAIKVCYKTRKADFDVFQHRVVSPGVPFWFNAKLQPTKMW